MSPLLSILVPTYHRAGYLRECLASLIATTVDCEIVVADNASPDHTPEVVASFRDPRIRYHRHAENIGSTANHNFLLGTARGKYLCLFGDDDAALPGCFERKLEVLEGHPDVDLVYSRIAGMDAESREMAVSPVVGLMAHPYIGGRDEFRDLFVNCYISWQTMVFRRTAFEAVGDFGNGLGLKAAIDWYWLQKLVRGRQTAYLDEPTVRIRFHAASYTTAEAGRGGYFLEDRLEIWRRWLLEDPQPFMPSDNVWDRMAIVLISEARRDGGDEQAAMNRLGALHHAFLQRMRERFQAELAAFSCFGPDTPPWPLEGARPQVFFHHPRWDGGTWKEVVRAYAAAFRAEAPTTLVLCLDPAQGVSLDEAGERIMAALPGEGAPDMLLIPDPLDAPGLARLYAAASVIVAPGDPLAAARARRMGRPVLESLEPSAWRAAP